MNVFSRLDAIRCCGVAAAIVLVAASSVSPAASRDEAETIEGLFETWTGDLDGMIERHRIRALVVYSKTFFFLDGAAQKGVSHDILKAFEKSLNKKLKKKTREVQIVFIPVSRDELIPGLLSGRGDIAVANLTITPERLKEVDFSNPFLSSVKEVVIAGPKSPRLNGVDDLSGQSVFVRKSSSYYDSLVALNENLEDEDLLEMVNAGLLPLIVMDDHKAKFWDQIFENIKVHEDIVVRRGGEIGWAFRKDSPRLAEAVNAFVKENKKGTLLGNILFKRYLKDTQYITNSLAGEELERFKKTIDLFRAYAKRYDFDWIILAALGYQESRLDQSLRSPVGAIGVMQVLPSTASDPNVGISGIEELENNIHAGVKYLHFLRSRYFSDDSMSQLNQWLFSFASYNAGPAKVSRLRAEARKSGLDPNVWFRNVEVIAAKRVGRETVQYVSNIYKYYIAYNLIIEQNERKKRAKETLN
jgi:membrane-bound lytic murein transglycosylase MltF